MPVVQAVADYRLPVPSRRFETVDGFRSGLRAVCGDFAVTPRQGARQFRGSIGAARLGGFDIADIALDAQSATRDLRAINADQGRYLFFILQTHGQALLKQDTLVAHLREGDFFVCDSARPCHFEFAGRYSRQISVHLRHDEAVQRFGQRLRVPLHLAAGSPLSAAMRGVLQFLLSEDPSRPAADALMQSFFLIFAVSADGFTRHAPGPDGILGNALNEIERAYDDPGLCPSELASRLGVSIRTLQRAFAPLGISPRQRITSVRLDRVHAALRKSKIQGSSDTITNLALANGFNDLSFFYRSFRHRFTVAPGAVLGRGGD